MALTAANDGNQDIFIWDLARNVPTRLTFDKAQDFQPVWTPDGKRIVFASSRDGRFALYGKSADGTGAEEKLGSMPERSLLPWCWSGDGKTLVVQETDFARWDISMLSMEGERARKPLLHDEYTKIMAKVSPDGRSMAYVSNESGRSEIYVRPFPEVDNGKWQVSTGGGRSAVVAGWAGVVLSQ